MCVCSGTYEEKIGPRDKGVQVSRHLSSRLAFGVVPLAALSLVLTACSTGVSSDSGSTSAAETTAAAETSAAETSAAASDVTPVGNCVFGGERPTGTVSIEKGPDITVAIVPKLLGLSVFEANVKGAEEVAPDLGITVEYTASVEANASDQAEVLQGLINRNNPPDVIAYSANDPTTIVPVLQEAMKKGIHVIGFDSDISAEGREAFIQNTSYPAMGKAFIEQTVKEYGDTGTIGIISTTTDATIQNEWIKAITDYAKATYPNLAFTPVVYGESNAAKTQTEVTNLLNQFPDVIALYALDSSAAPGTLAALKAQGLGGQIGVWGVSTPKANLQYFEDKSINGLWLWDEVGEGRLIAYLARAVCDGNWPAVGGTMTAGELGDFTVIDEPAPNTVIFSEPLLFDQSNYKNYDF